MANFRKEFRKAQQLAKRNNDLNGSGSYLFENNTRGDWHLPRPTKEGVRVCKLGGQFVGDDYYMQFMKPPFNEIRLIRNLNEPELPEKLFVYKNFNRDEVKLPEANRDGQWFVPPTGEFVGDSRYFPLLKQGKLKLIREVESQMQDKLLTEVPPIITHEGKVEFVKVTDQQLNEDERKKKEKLLSENPLEGVKLLLD